MPNNAYMEPRSPDDGALAFDKLRTSRLTIARYDTLGLP